MAQAEATEFFKVTPERLFAVITDYENYPQFLKEVKDCRVLSRAGTSAVVEYSVNVIKSYSYRLKMSEEPYHKVSWTFDGGDLFKSLNGSWTLTPKDDGVAACYRVDATFKIFVPGPMAKALVSVNLPTMMAAYQKRLGELKYG